MLREAFLLRFSACALCLWPTICTSSSLFLSVVLSFSRSVFFCAVCYARSARSRPILSSAVPCCLPPVPPRLRASNHHECFLATEQEGKLVDHSLHDVLQIWAHRFEAHHIGELDRQQRRPPADRQILAVHAVKLRILRHPVAPSGSECKRERKAKEMQRLVPVCLWFATSLCLCVPHEVLEYEAEDREIAWWQLVQQPA